MGILAFAFPEPALGQKVVKPVTAIEAVGFFVVVLGFMFVAGVKAMPPATVAQLAGQAQIVFVGVAFLALIICCQMQGTTPEQVADQLLLLLRSQLVNILYGHGLRSRTGLGLLHSAGLSRLQANQAFLIGGFKLDREFPFAIQGNNLLYIQAEGAGIGGFD